MQPALFALLMLGMTAHYLIRTNVCTPLLHRLTNCTVVSKIKHHIGSCPLFLMNGSHSLWPVHIIFMCPSQNTVMQYSSPAPMTDIIYNYELGPCELILCIMTMQQIFLSC
uniref:Putative secreted protein n=1 Tax=Ixodes ricinus TaxID=34613 RepID=A0A147BRE0_IXORI